MEPVLVIGICTCLTIFLSRIRDLVNSFHWGFSLHHPQVFPLRNSGAGVGPVGMDMSDLVLPQRLEDLLPFPPDFRGGYM